jgi:hypothetical protein
MPDLAFWIPCLGFPLAALFANVAVRAIRGLPQSALPDLILCFVVFDALVAIQNQDFKKFIRIDFVRDATIACYGALLFINTVVWVLSITELEYQLAECHKKNRTILNREGIRALFYSIVICSMVIFVSVPPFAYGG